jgi:DNA (cytosine-5)-methyltransferase 1
MTKNNTKLPIRVAELFAGVGGFHLGLVGNKKQYKDEYNLVWSNQWEPATKTQHASEIYKLRFPKTEHSNENIATVNVDDIPDFDLLVGGFPCQDYSVARTLSQACGLVGKKGVLWWQIHRILSEKTNQDKTKPKYIFLENVDRLLKSPAGQRGRDFALMLASLSDLGYAVEWRVINAADYGMPQKRRRIFIIGYHKSSSLYPNKLEMLDWMQTDGIFAKSFPAKFKEKTIPVNGSIVGEFADISDKFNKETGSLSPFKTSGVMINRNYLTVDIKADYNGKRTVLKDILQKEEVPEQYYLSKEEIALNEEYKTFKENNIGRPMDSKYKKSWAYLKGSKNEPRKNSNGFEFIYTEGPLPFPDPLDRPARTIITSEGGKAPSRFKHVVEVKGRPRRLTPIELEALNMFPENHTKEATDTKRAFFMGNALVVGVINDVARELSKRINNK